MLLQGIQLLRNISLFILGRLSDAEVMLFHIFDIFFNPLAIDITL